MKTFITVVASVIVTIALLVSFRLWADGQPRTYTVCASARTVSLNGTPTTGKEAEWSAEECETRTYQP